MASYCVRAIEYLILYFLRQHVQCTSKNKHLFNSDMPYIYINENNIVISVTSELCVKLHLIAIITEFVIYQDVKICE